MSAIGSYEVLTRDGFAASLEAARNVRTETSGRWIFKTSEEKGREAFDIAWRASLVERVDFDYSGYVLGNYLDAQYEINGLRLFDEESEPSLALSKVFTAAFLFRIAAHAARSPGRETRGLLPHGVPRGRTGADRAVPGRAHLLRPWPERDHERQSGGVRHSMMLHLTCAPDVCT